MCNDPDGLDRDIRDALATALRERNRMIYRRMLVLFVAFVAATTLVLYLITQAQHRFERGVVVSCHASQVNARNFNELIDRITDTYKTSPVLTPAQRRDRVAFFRGSKQQIPVCPARR